MLLAQEVPRLKGLLCGEEVALVELHAAEAKQPSGKAVGRLDLLGEYPELITVYEELRRDGMLQPVMAKRVNFTQYILKKM